MPATPETTETACPTCGAAAGVPCTVTRTRTGGSATEHGSEHLARFDRHFRRLDRTGGAR